MNTFRVEKQFFNEFTTPILALTFDNSVTKEEENKNARDSDKHLISSNGDESSK